MNEAKRKKLEAAGFTLTQTKDFIGLTIEENKIVEMRVALAAEDDILDRQPDESDDCYGRTSEPNRGNSPAVHRRKMIGMPLYVKSVFVNR